MSDTPEFPESVARHAARAACRCAVVILVLVAGGAHANAQQPGPQPVDQPPTAPEFFPRFNFQLAANSLGGGDPRFMSDAHFGGAADLVDYVNGRASVVADYEAVLGSEFRAFDPNQGIYILELSASGWISGNEIAGVFHHVSRHISDRPKRYAIAWNVAGVRLLRTVDLPYDIRMAVRAGGGKVVQRADVDYDWTADLDVTVRRPINPHVDAYVRGSGELFTVDPSVRGRTDTPRGGRVEAGVRLGGKGGTLELFAGVERRLDADPYDYFPMTWAIAGFRMATK